MKSKASADAEPTTTDVPTEMPPWRDVMSTICHDLRDPLASVVMGTRFLKRALPTDDSADATRRVVDAMARSADRMNQLLADLGDLTKLERNQLKLRKAKHDIAPLARSAHDELATRALTHSIETSIAIAPGAETVSTSCDGERMKQILVLLGAGALHVVPEKGSVALRVDADDATLSFRVETASSPNAEAGRGSPPMAPPKLGVALAKGLIELHGGTLTASRRGSSVAFAFSIPRE